MGTESQVIMSTVGDPSFPSPSGQCPVAHSTEERKAFLPQKPDTPPCNPTSLGHPLARGTSALLRVLLLFLLSVFFLIFLLFLDLGQPPKMRSEARGEPTCRCT